MYWLALMCVYYNRLGDVLVSVNVCVLEQTGGCIGWR